MSTAPPYRWTGTMARVRGPIASSTRAGPRLRVTGSTSTKTGTAQDVCGTRIAYADGGHRATIRGLTGTRGHAYRAGAGSVGEADVADEVPEALRARAMRPNLVFGEGLLGPATARLGRYAVTT